jgi:hypothetical protein
MHFGRKMTTKSIKMLKNSHVIICSSILIIESIEALRVKNKKQNAQIRVGIYLAEEITTNWIQGTYQSGHNSICIYIKILCVR